MNESEIEIGQSEEVNQSLLSGDSPDQTLAGGPASHSTSQASELTTKMVGTLFDGKYRIVRLLGMGGLAAVFEAIHEDIGRLEAIKVLLPQWSGDGLQVKRFRREAQILSAISHPGIAAVFSCGLTEDGALFLTMEYVEGKTLSQFLSEGDAVELTSEQWCEIFLSIAEAIAFAHARGIVHRDLKPQNIMIAPIEKTGRYKVKVLDFGIAKVFSDEARQKLTTTGAMLGSPAYMSPEQFTGGQVGTASDIYSFGCMLYEAIAGAGPFKSETVFDFMNAHVQQTPPAIPIAGLDPARVSLSAIAIKCLAKLPEDRFVSMSAIVEALKGIMDAPTVTLKFDRPKGASLAARGGRSDSRSKRNWRIAAAVLGTLVVAVGGWYWTEARKPTLSSEYLSSGEFQRIGNQFYGDAEREERADKRLILMRQAGNNYRAALEKSLPDTASAFEIRRMLARCLREQPDDPRNIQEAKQLFEQILTYYVGVKTRLRHSTSRRNAASAIADAQFNLGLLSLVDKDFEQAGRYFEGADRTLSEEGESDWGPVWGKQLVARYQRRPRDAEKNALALIELMRVRSMDDWFRALMIVDAMVDIKEANNWTMAQTREHVRKLLLDNPVSDGLQQRNEWVWQRATTLAADDKPAAQKRAWEVTSDATFKSHMPASRLE